MNLRWLWFDHIPPGIELNPAQRRQLRHRAKDLRAAHPSTRHKHGALIVAITTGSILEAGLLLFVVIYVFPQARTPVGQALTIYGLPALICIPFWLILAITFNRSHSPFVRAALNEMGHPVCIACGYALRGLGARIDRCPECGAVHTFDDVEASAPRR